MCLVENQKWVNVFPQQEDFNIEPSNFFICEKHLSENKEIIKLPGLDTQPACLVFLMFFLVYQPL